MAVYTIGYTEKSAQRFFELLKKNNVKTVLDVRINNSGQLAGFSKKDDLKFFLKELAGIEYVHLVDLAPTKSLLAQYKNKEIGWEEYEARFLELMEFRRIEERYSLDDMASGCFLCSEHLPHKCHRRLVVEFLIKKTGELVEVSHLA